MRQECAVASPLKRFGNAIQVPAFVRIEKRASDVNQFHVQLFPFSIVKS
jgi:hypothetical protein